MLQSPEDWLAEVSRREREGELFRAYDLASQGLALFPDDFALKHRAVLCLASTGATRQAAELIDRLGLDTETGTPLRTQLELDVAALRPRLLKDQALATTGQQRAAKLFSAAEAYADVYRRARAADNRVAYYPGINAASLYLLAGQAEPAFGLAREVLRQLAEWPADEKAFYELASELEAQLVLGDMDRAGATMELVCAAIRGEAQADYRGLSSSVRQLRSVLAAKGLASEWLDALSPPRVIHYLGHIVAPPGRRGRFPATQERAVVAAIAQALDNSDVGFGYGSLAAGADILFAEALLARAASLHIVLPFDREDFVDISVRPAGAEWVARFDACLERASTVRYATEDRYLGDDHLFSYCSELAMGLALLRARHLSALAEQIVVWDGDATVEAAGTAADMASWRRSGMPQMTISVGDGFRPPRRTGVRARGLERRTRAMLFGDVHGFSKLSDAQLPAFIETILGTFARVIDQARPDVLLANTWGDGLFVVFDDAGKAAECALVLQEEMNRLDLSAHGLPADMALRIGLHLGPVYAARDPILGHENFFGAHVTRAARVEPVTPDRCVYVTETMAAVLALYNADAFSCEYVGVTEAAKQYGRLGMFYLKRSAG